MASPAPPASAFKAPPAPTQGTTPGGRRGGRGGGRGRGRGRERGREGERERRPAVATDGAVDAEGKSGGKRDKQGTGGGGKRRGGGARAAAAKPRAARGRKGSGGGSGSGGPAAQKKLLVRNIPHGVSEEEACAALEAAGVARESIWRFVAGKAHGKNRAPTPARAYLDVKKGLAPADALIASLDGQTWPPTAAGKGAPTAKSLGGGLASTDCRSQQSQTSCRRPSRRSRSSRSRWRSRRTRRSRATRRARMPRWARSTATRSS